MSLSRNWLLTLLLGDKKHFNISRTHIWIYDKCKISWELAWGFQMFFYTNACVWVLHLLTFLFRPNRLHIYMYIPEGCILNSKWCSQAYEASFFVSPIRVWSISFIHCAWWWGALYESSLIRLVVELITLAKQKIITSAFAFVVLSVWG